MQNVRLILGNGKTPNARRADNMERQLPFNPYEVCGSKAPQRTTFKVDDINIVFQPQVSPSNVYIGTAISFRQIIEGKLHAMSNTVTPEELRDEACFNAKFEQLLAKFEESLKGEL